MGDGRAIEYVLKYVWCLKTKTSADPWALMSVKPQTWFSKPNLYWRQPDSVAIFNLRNRASIMSAIWNNLFQSLIWVLDWWLSVVCCGGLWLLSLLWTVLAVDLDWLLWTICGLWLQWTFCGLWLLNFTVVDCLWSGLWWTVVDCGWLLCTVWNCRYCGLS